MIYFLIGRNTRLGNWMFQYAAALSLGRDVTAIMPDAAFVSRVTRYAFFKNLKWVTAAPNGVAVYHEPEFRYHPIPCADGSDLVLEGFFQSPKYFDAPVVRAAFRMEEARRSRLTHDYAEPLAKADITAIHVRRGDYLKNRPLHPFVGKKFLREAVLRMPDVRNFLVCSDDIPWCRKFFLEEFPDRTFWFSSNTDPLDDLYLTSLCHHNIISNSSFGWWGAWLNEHADKRVIAPSLWFGYVYSKQGIDWRDIYYDGMEIVDNGYTPRTLFVAHCSWRWIKFKFWATPVYRWVMRRMGRTFE